MCHKSSGPGPTDRILKPQDLVNAARPKGDNPKVGTIDDIINQTKAKDGTTVGQIMANADGASQHKNDEATDAEVTLRDAIAKADSKSLNQLFAQMSADTGGFAASLGQNGDTFSTG